MLPKFENWNGHLSAFTDRPTLPDSDHKIVAWTYQILRFAKNLCWVTVKFARKVGFPNCSQILWLLKWQVVKVSLEIKRSSSLQSHGPQSKLRDECQWCPRRSTSSISASWISLNLGRNDHHVCVTFWCWRQLDWWKIYSDFVVQRHVSTRSLARLFLHNAFVIVWCKSSLC